MPPAAKRDLGIILFDVNASNKDEAVAALIKICTFNWLSNTKSTYQLILTNTKETKNKKNLSNLYETGLDYLDPQPILDAVTGVEAEAGDWLDAVLLAVHHLKEGYGLPGVITLQILYITKLDGCSQEANMRKVERIVNELREYEIYLYIIGPDVKLPFTITTRDDVPEAMKDLKFVEDRPALEIAKRIIDATPNSVICDLKVGIHLFFSFKNSRGIQPFKVPLAIGSKIEIPTNTTRVLKSDAPFKLVTDTAREQFVLKDDESVDVDFSCLVSGIERHGKFVRIQDTRMFRIEGPRSFSVIGFTHKRNIPEYYMREGSFHVLPEPKKPKDCSQALYNLVNVLAKENKYAIVRRVYIANTKPKFFVLVPEPDEEPKRFMMAQLPYADDLMQEFKFEIPKPKGDCPKDEFSKFFDSIDIFNDSCEKNILLGPNMLLDYRSSKCVNIVAEKYLKKDFSFDVIDIDYFGSEERNEFLKALQDAWPPNDQEGKENDDN